MSDAQSGRAPLAPSLDVVLRRFEAPDETRVFGRAVCSAITGCGARTLGGPGRGRQFFFPSAQTLSQ